tara:strand:- start:17 stop:592 length:576 start_codon:yes stop_codon:yes gene_type:complete
MIMILYVSIILIIAIIVLVVFVLSFFIIHNRIATASKTQCKTMLGDVTQCFTTKINKQNGDEYFKNGYTHIEIKSSKLNEKQILRSYDVEFEYNPFDSTYFNTIMFSASASRPLHLRVGFNKAVRKGRLTMGFHKVSRKDKYTNITMYMSPYIPSLKITKIISKELDIKHAILNSSLGSFVKEKHAYSIKI